MQIIANINKNISMIDLYQRAKTPVVVFLQK